MMETQSVQRMLENLLASTGITFNGSSSFDIQVHHPQFYKRALSQGALGLGESYMDGWWDCEKIDVVMDKISRANLSEKITKSKRLIFRTFLLRLFNYQTKQYSLEVGKKHYDLSNELFQGMLDSRMNYTCGYWKEAKTLEEAQLAKLKLTCEKLLLKPGMRLLDIGCGWGGFAKFAAENYGVSVVGVTISKEQYHYAKEMCQTLPIEIRFQDYRDIKEKFDRVVSLGMFEHVGHRNYATYMKIVHDCLTEEGIFVLHTIGANMTDVPNEWITKYIFPHGMLPSIQLIGKAIEKHFVMEDWHNFGADYDKTLMSWYENFKKVWPTLKTQYDERFYRMWTYYLLSCAGTFRARDTQLWQVVLSKKGMLKGYQAPR